MRIAFVHNLQTSPGEDEAELDRPETVKAIADALQRLGHDLELIEVSGPVARTVARLESIAPDLVFNTAKGRSGRAREAFYPALLEGLGLPFTGSDAYTSTLTLDKRRSKLLAEAEGVLSAGDEAHIPGRDIAVPYLEGAAKGAGGILEPADYALTPDEKERVVQASRRIIQATGLRDFGQLDFRLGEDGKLYFLEVNALPSLDAGAPIYRSAKAAGIESMGGVLDAIVRSASDRFGIPQRIAERARAKKKGLRVGLTFNLKRVASTADGEVDSDAEYDSPKVIASVRSAIESYGHEVVELEATPELVAIIGAAQVDVVFNVAEGIRGRNREAQVPAILELLDIPYTGSDPATLSLALDKALAKRVVAQAGILTAPFVTMVTGKERLPKELQFPAIVKPVAEGSSKGVMKTSVVENEAELRELVKLIIGKYRQAALVEAYLSGREFTIALLGEKKPRCLPPMEIVFINKETRRPVYAFDHKLDWSTEIRYDRPAQVDEALHQELERVAKGAFFALGCRDLARVDLRLDANGRVNFIEVNPLPGLSWGWSDLCLIAESAGMDYRTLIGEIMAPCLKRHRERRRALFSN
jgi:D-alanine-D-alanine ligase